MNNAVNSLLYSNHSVSMLMYTAWIKIIIHYPLFIHDPEVWIILLISRLLIEHKKSIPFGNASRKG